MQGADKAFLQTLSDKVAEYKALVDTALEDELYKYSYSNLYHSLRYGLEGGKRIRPIILMLSAEAVGGRAENVLSEAVAVELLHTESIIHDDIIDDEVIRRNKPVFHLKHGYNAALLTADFVFGIILDIASRSTDRSVAKELADASLKMCEGEVREMIIEAEKSEVTLEEYLNIIADKTASLFKTAATIGARIGSGNGDYVEALAEYGLNIGIAYQIQDDILDWRDGSKIARRLKVEGDVKGTLTQIAAKYALEAKKRIQSLPETEAKQILTELADFAINRLA